MPTQTLTMAALRCVHVTIRENQVEDGEAVVIFDGQANNVHIEFEEDPAQTYQPDIPARASSVNVNVTIPRRRWSRRWGTLTIPRHGKCERCDDTLFPQTKAQCEVCWRWVGACCRWTCQTCGIGKGTGKGRCDDHPCRHAPKGKG